MTNETIATNELIIEETFDLYQVLWIEGYESTRTIAIAKTAQEARDIIAQHMKDAPSCYQKFCYEIEGWNIGDVRPCY